MAATEEHRGDGDPDLCRPALQELALGMPGRDVRDLVTDHGSELVLIARRLEDTLVHDDLAAGHHERVDLVRLDDRHLPVVVAVGRLQDLDDGAGDAGDVVDRLPVGRQRGGRLDLGKLAGSLRLHFGIGTRLRGCCRQQDRASGDDRQ